MRLILTIAYDGRPFHGWQSQPSGNTVQDRLESALSEILGGNADDNPRVHGSGRTDTGVHALAQVAHFDLPAEPSLTPSDWLRALNANLPPAIRITACTEATAPGFHARFSATGKTYRYDLYTGPVLPPLLHGLAWHRPRGVDVALLEQCCRLFEGTHDFTNFATNRRNETEEQRNDPATTTRIIHKVSLSTAPAQPHLVSLTFDGSGFLYHMARLLTGSAVRVAQNRRPIDWLQTLLENRDAPKSSFCAPPDGLHLIRVHYS